MSTCSERSLHRSISYRALRSHHKRQLSVSPYTTPLHSPKLQMSNLQIPTSRRVCERVLQPLIAWCATRFGIRARAVTAHDKLTMACPVLPREQAHSSLVAHHRSPQAIAHDQLSDKLCAIAHDQLSVDPAVICRASCHEPTPAELTETAEHASTVRHPPCTRINNSQRLYSRTRRLYACAPVRSAMHQPRPNDQLPELRTGRIRCSSKSSEGLTQVRGK